MDFTNAIKRPFSDLKKFLIGSVLALIPIVNLFVMGYGLECARLTFKKKNNLPEWTNWGDLFVHGLLSAVIGFIYAIPALILLGIGFVIGGMSLFTSIMMGPITDPVSTAGLVSAMPLFGIGALLLLLTMYIMPSALLTYAKNYKFKDAFDFKTVFKKAFTGKYFGALFVSWIIGIIIMAILGFVPYLGSAVATFITTVFMYTLVAEAYSK